MLAGSYTGGPLNGLIVTNGYDSLLRRTALGLASQPAPLAQFAYDPDSGRLQTVTSGEDSATYSYLANSPLVENITFQHDGTTRMTTTKRYDALNRLTSITNAPSDGAPVGFRYVYNPANQRTTVTNADASRWVYQYDQLGQVISGKKYWSDGTPVAGQQFEYAFDHIGNRRTNGFGGNEAGLSLRESRYTVNDLNQLTSQVLHRASQSWPCASRIAVTSRTIPGFVNVLGEATNTASVSVNTNLAYRKDRYFRAELTVNNTAGPVWLGITNVAVMPVGGGNYVVSNVTGHVLWPKTPETFTYDADGNLTSDGRWSITWDAENRATSFTRIAGAPAEAKVKVECEYDHRGRRTQKIVSTWNGSAYVPQATNKFVYDDWHLIAILDAQSAILYSFTWGTDLGGSIQGAGGVGGLLSLTVHQGANAGTYFYAFDGNGNVVALVNASNGEIAGRWEYDPFGNILRATGPLAYSNPFLFSTKFCDWETGFYDFGYRYYDPSTGRWPNRDPIGELGGLNLYGFVDNDPVSLVDPLGQEILVIAGRYKDTGTAFSLESVQSNWGIKRFANRVRRAFQEIVGDCAKLELADAGTDRISVPASGGTKTVERKRFRITFSGEKASCKCNDCWQLLKRAIQDTRADIEIRYLVDRDNAAYMPPDDSVYVNPGVNVRLPERDSKGGYPRKRVPFPIVLWHEGIGHDYQGFGHPNIPANHTPTWDGVYIDPTIQEENRARNCTRLAGERYGGFLGLFGRSLGDRIPTYYDNP